MGVVLSVEAVTLRIWAVGSGLPYMECVCGRSVKLVYCRIEWK